MLKFMISYFNNLKYIYMCVCMTVYIHMCVSVCVCIYIDIYIHVCVCVYVSEISSVRLLSRV